MMPILEQSASASSMECVVSTTARDCAMREINAHMCRRVSGSIPVEGSSRNVTYTTRDGHARQPSIFTSR